MSCLHSEDDWHTHLMVDVKKTNVSGVERIRYIQLGSLLFTVAKVDDDSGRSYETSCGTSCVEYYLLVALLLVRITYVCWRFLGTKVFL
jgi:hypothetical protein